MIRYSTGLVDFMMTNGSFRRGFNGGCIKVRTGSQPASADTASSGTLLCTYSSASGALTAETRPAASVTLATGAAGSVDTITIGGYEIMGAAVAYNTSLSQTATDVATQINKFNSKGFAECTAAAVAAKITITAVQGSGNITGATVATCTTITTTDVAMGTETAGVNQANGLQFGASAAGVLSKSGTWSGVAAATGTAGWFRTYSTITDGDGASTVLVRMDGSCGTTGADLNMATTSLVATNTYTIDTATFTLPLTA